MRRPLVLAVVALSLAACTEQTVSAAGAKVTSPSASSFGTDFPERAHGFLRANPETPPKHYQRVVVAATGVSGPADHLRWNAVVVWGDGTLGTVESGLGDSNALNILVQRGDYLWVRPRFGMITAEETRVRRKAAVSAKEGA